MKSRIYLSILIALLIGFFSNGVGAQDEADYASKQQAFNLYQKALAAFKIGDFNGCTLLCRQAIDLDNQDKLFFHLEALSLSESGDNEQALLAFRSALAIDFNYIQCRNNMGLFEMKLGKFEDAKVTFRECIKNST